VSSIIYNTVVTEGLVGKRSRRGCSDRTVEVFLSLSSRLEADVSLVVNLTLQGLTLKESEPWRGEREIREFFILFFLVKLSKFVQYNTVCTVCIILISMIWVHRGSVS
jgi:hypothetical protein